MSNEQIDADSGEVITRTRDEPQTFNPFGKETAERNVGGAMQSARANTEVLAMVMSAKQFPRNQIAASDRILNAFTRPTLAEQAQYQFARGGSDITGPSIRAAEAISQQWGNMSNGWRELSRTKGADGVGISECEAFSIDYENNSRESIQFHVRHWRDTKNGGYALRDERDIYELCANQSQRRKRACILAQIPGDVTEMAMQQASVTLTSKANTTPEGIAALEATFAEFGVTREHIEKRIQKRIEAISAAQVVSLKRIYQSLRDGMSEPHAWFEIKADEVKSDGLEKVRAAAKSKKEKKAGKPAATTADPAAAPVVEQAGAEGGGLFDDTQYAKFAEQIKKATDGETAALVLDEARGVLSAEVHEQLSVFWKQAWQR
jgi:hypothetical protein